MSGKNSPRKFPIIDREYLHAKIHALRPVLLKRSSYEQMAGSGRAHLAFPGLALDPVRDSSITVREKIFNAEINIIRRFLKISPHYHSLFLNFLRLFELHNLKQLLARAFSRPYIRELWYDIRPWQSFNRELLQEDLTPKDIRQILKTTYLAQTADHDDITRKFETAESLIELNFLRSMLHKSPDLSSRQYQRYANTVRIRLEILKKIWACRLEQNYGWPGSKIDQHFEWLNRISTEIRGADPKPEKIAQQLENHLYEDKMPRHLSASELEQALEKSFQSYMWKKYNTDFFAIDCVVCYLWLLYNQIQNLFKITEGLYADTAPQKIMSRLIC